MKARSFPITLSFKAKVSDYAQLTKMRLASLVVFSALTGYFFATGISGIQWMEIAFLVVGGFFVTGASNALNQVIERDLDAMMNRTENRPIPDGRMSVNEGLIVAFVLGVVGVLILWFGLNPLSGILGTLALFLYAAVYTPMKRIGPVAVFIGAFPGAIPPMLGYVAATNHFGLIPGLLFATQFFWQFPHFWAIAWKADKDYAKAGFRLLPSSGGKNKASAFQILIYTIALIPISLTPLYFTEGNLVQYVIISLTGLAFLFYAIKLYATLDEKAALKLMFVSFVYLPIVQLFYLI